MNREDVIRVAREAGFSSAVGKHIALDVDLERFAALVAAAAVEREREACAKVCEAEGLLWGQRYATAIRARSKQ